MINLMETRLTRQPHGATVLTAPDRVKAQGKFLFIGDRKFWVKGVTYGTFRPSEEGFQFPSPDTVARDFAAMADKGFNTVRTYTVPPRWLLDTAQRNGLRVLVGLPWEQHVTFLDDAKLVGRIKTQVRDGVKACAGHPAVLGYTVGNEIPSSIVRWHGHRRIERFIKRLYQIAKREDPEALVTYVNFPTTEYLQLPFLDLFCFNVYLESRDSLDGYLARLQNLADERPLLMAEIGLDSRRNGVEEQARSLDWQVRTAFAAGCAGTFVFAWTDEWYRGGFDIEDWDFGLVARDRQPKPALATVGQVFAAIPFPADTPWPKISVVVCSYNGARTLRDTMEGLQALAYPHFEVIVVNDGSTDATPEIAAAYNVKLISTQNRGLSAARNTGWQAATGEIIAYIDDDAYPDPHWLHYLAHTYLTTDFVGVGGPNIAPPGDGPIAECVYNAPGGPVHVLVSDREAEHIPGCNMSFRRGALDEVGGFDPRFRAAGDDVDLCWRLQARGGKIGFHPAAVVWHHRRNSLKMYWKQQQGYGKAEALLEEKWPEKYNAMGHLSWAGRLYGRGLTEALGFRSARIYHGQWGTALFQSLYQPPAGLVASLPQMPEWYLIIGILLFLALLGADWPPLLVTIPVLAVAVFASVMQAVISAARAKFPTNRTSPFEKLQLYGLTATLHLMQPAARLIGRLRHGLNPLRQRVANCGAIGRNGVTLWSETWNPPEAWVASLRESCASKKLPIRVGSDFDGWDLEVRGGLLASARALLAVEEHGAGRQQVRLRLAPKVPFFTIAFLVVIVGLAFGAATDQSWIAAFILAGSLIFLLFRALVEYLRAVGVVIETIDHLQPNLLHH